MIALLGLMALKVLNPAQGREFLAWQTCHLSPRSRLALGFSLTTVKQPICL